MLDLLVILVNYNGLSDLQRLLPGLMVNIELVKNGRICVVDNASEDNSVQWITENYPDVSLVMNDKNMGFSRANNQGLKTELARYYLLLNTDTEFRHDDTLSQCLTFMETNAQVGMMGCVLLNSDLTLQPSTYIFPSFSGLVLRATGIKPILRNLQNRRKTGAIQTATKSSYPVQVVKGAFCFVRGNLVPAIGLLDEITFMYGEEADWAFRFWQHGWEVHYYLNAELIHHGSTRRHISLLEIEKLRGQFNFVGKHRSLFLMRTLAFIFGLSYALRYLFEETIGHIGKSPVHPAFNLYNVVVFCWRVCWQGDIYALPYPNVA